MLEVSVELHLVNTVVAPCTAVTVAGLLGCVSPNFTHVHHNHSVFMVLELNFYGCCPTGN